MATDSGSRQRLQTMAKDGGSRQLLQTAATDSGYRQRQQTIRHNVNNADTLSFLNLILIYFERLHLLFFLGKSFDKRLTFYTLHIMDNVRLR